MLSAAWNVVKAPYHDIYFDQFKTFDNVIFVPLINIGYIFASNDMQLSEVLCLCSTYCNHNHCSCLAAQVDAARAELTHELMNQN